MEALYSIGLLLLGAFVAFLFSRFGKKLDEPERDRERTDNEFRRADDKYVNKEVCAMCQKAQAEEVKRQDERLKSIEGYVESVDERTRETALDVKKILKKWAEV